MGTKLTLKASNWQIPWPSCKWEWKKIKLALRQDSSDRGRNPCITYKTSSSVKTSVLSQRQLCNLFPLLSIGLLIKHYKPLFWYANRPFWQSNQFTIDNMSHITCFCFVLFFNILVPSEICHITEVKISRKRFMLTFKSNKRLAWRQFTFLLSRITVSWRTCQYTERVIFYVLKKMDWKWTVSD